MQTEGQEQVNFAPLIDGVNGAITNTENVLESINGWLGGTDNIQAQIEAAIGNAEEAINREAAKFLAILHLEILAVKIALGLLNMQQKTALSDINTAKEQALAAIAQARPGPLQTADNPEFQAPHRLASPEIV